MIKREIEKQIREYLFSGRVILIYGPRRVGKTTLVKHILEDYKDTGEYIQLDDPIIKSQFETGSVDQLVSLLKSTTKLLVLDEAQSVNGIGQKLKLLVDKFPELQIIATGSSSFELQNEVSSPLTGRKVEFNLFPLSLVELKEYEGANVLVNKINTIFQYGLYPSIYISDNDKVVKLVSEITASYLFKDILTYQDVRNPKVLQDLLKALALQVGGEVSSNELANLLGIDRSTVDRYIDLLEKIFVIKVFRAYSNNLRNELNKKFKVYFWDLGIRNALLNNFNEISIRNDVGAIWENFCVLERVKLHSFASRQPSMYFWRNYQGQEIDLIEEMDGKIKAFEFKYSKTKSKLPNEFINNYPDSEYTLINKDNFLSEILKS
jgi:predicted AAA+ superfamily ATPase